ncbi:MAG: substrate-binding domain-containing protein [Dehalococcoidales bacterium]|nr:substrate-binding domain-containing protein [Dehalococcoidales bacterium]
MKNVFRISLAILACVAILSGSISCSGSDVGVLKPQERLVVATTSSLYDTGLWALLEPKFEDKYMVELDVLYANTGIAIEYGKRGDADVLAVHDKARELALITDGYAIDRYPFAYNYFVIAGPASDPAGIKGLSPEAAFKKLFENKTDPFISRGDNSGTHSKEKAIWLAAGFEYADVQKSGSWYVEGGIGMGPALVMAGQLNGYILSDIGTFLAYKGETGLAILVDTGNIMLNVYSIVSLSPTKISGINSTMAQNMVDFLLSDEIQKVIGDYGVKDYGVPLFTPCAGNEPTS